MAVKEVFSVNLESSYHRQNLLSKSGFSMRLFLTLKIKSNCAELNFRESLLKRFSYMKSFSTPKMEI